MHRAVAEQEIASTWVHAPKHIGVVDRVVAVGLVREVAVGENQGFVEVRIVVGGAISLILALGGRSIGGCPGYGSHPRGDPSSRHCADPCGWGVGGAALADEVRVAQSVTDGGDARVTIAPKYADAGRAKPTGHAHASDAVRGVSGCNRTVVGVAVVEVEG